MHRILFVHNAHSGLGNKVVDGVKKTLRPSTYPCKLCAVTWGYVRVKKDWEDFLETLEGDVEVLYKDQFDKQFEGHPFNMPAVFVDDGKQLEVKISDKDFDDIATLEDLIKMCKERLV